QNQQDPDNEAGLQHASTKRRTAQERKLSERLRRRRLERAHGRDQHEDPPKAVDDGWNGGEQLRQKNERLANGGRGELGDEDGDAERDRRRDKQSKDRRIQRAPDERQRAELTRHRIPDFGPPEVEAELLNRQRRLPGEL